MLSSALLALRAFLRTRLGQTAGAILAVFLVLVATVWAYQAAIARAEARGRAGALASIAQVADSTAAARVLQARALWDAQAKTDTVIRYVTRRAEAAGQAIAAIPPAVRDSVPPAVEVALDACEALVADTAKLRQAIVTERLEARKLFALDTVAIEGLKAQVVQRDDRIKHLERRPPWWKVIVGGVLTAGAAFALGASS